MPSVYLLKENGKTEPMEKVLCKDETKELQDMLANNYDLLLVLRSINALTYQAASGLPE